MDVWNLRPGAVIRIVKSFRDCYGAEFSQGRVLHFTHRNYLPYHAGHTVCFQEATIYLCDNDETCAIVQNHNDEYFVVTGQSEEIARQLQSAYEERMRQTLGASNREQYKTVLLGMLAVAIAFGVAIPLGFWLRSGYPTISDRAFGAIVAVLVFGIALGVMRLLHGPLWGAKKRKAGRARPANPAMDPHGEASGNSAGRRTGYEISLQDFYRLVSDPYCQSVSAPLLKEWYGYSIDGQGPETVVRTQEGDAVGLSDLHQQIQNDPSKQHTIYNRAMDLWR